MKSKGNDKITLSENASFMEVMQNIKSRKRTEKNRRNKARRKERKREWREKNQ
jgi:hypothetical protein